MNTENDQKLKWIQMTDAVEDAVNDYVDFSAPLGYVRRILAAYGYHDDVAARDCMFAIQQGAGVAMRDLFTAVSIAASVKQHLYSNCFFQEPITLRQDQKLRFVVGSLGAGKKAIMVVCYEEQRGHELYID